MKKMLGCSIKKMLGYSMKNLEIFWFKNDQETVAIYT